MEGILQRIFLVLALCCLLTVDGHGRKGWRNKYGYKRRFRPTTSSPSNCEENSKKIDVHLTLKNNLQPDFFEYNVTVRNKQNSPLIRYLEQAAEQDAHYKFAATYFTGLGYFINSINGLAGKWDPDQTYWEILNSDFEQTNLGVSSYIPIHEEWLIFNFTRGGH